VTTAKRSETRFCRIPQWLYSVGISLQAVALYGWLHGKYGWLPKINPSYATLAEELGVSRTRSPTTLRSSSQVVSPLTTPNLIMSQWSVG
jgi:hypothetical protein